MKNRLIKNLFLFIFFSCSICAYCQTVTYTNGSGIIFTLTPCSKERAINNIEFYMGARAFYHFNIYQFDYQNLLMSASIISGDRTDFEKIYNGFSYGSISIEGYNINCVMYCNSVTGQYSLIQFADFDLGGGIVHQNLKNIFERSIEQVNTK